MSICRATTAAGRPCPCKARVGFATCGRHKNVVVDTTVCGEYKTDGSRCQKKCVEGDRMCKRHRTVADRREQTRNARVVWIEAHEVMWGQVVGGNFNLVSLVADLALENGWITHETHADLIVQLRAEWVWYQRERLVPMATATTDLERLALDNQNVHTKEVCQQTSDAAKYLLETSLPIGPKTIAELETTWSGKNRKKVLRDVKTWYNTKTCVTDNDYLYKRMLDGLWVRIKNHKEREELTQRLWEEALESVDKCCQGHLSRLANVLVGFTEDVKAEVPVGEILQQKIAAIAEKDIGIEYKVSEAWAVFEELKVPMEERDAWIEAF